MAKDKARSHSRRTASHAKRSPPGISALLRHTRRRALEQLLCLRGSIRSRPFLEVIRFAAGNQLCVDLTYEGKVRRIKPYSLRETSAGYFLLHAVKSETGENRAYRLDRIEGASVTQQGYSPRYLIELTQEGPQPVAKTAIKKGTSSSGKLTSTSTIYVYRCGFCDETFKRSKLDAKLNPHKNSAGYPCSGRIGIYEGMR